MDRRRKEEIEREARRLLLELDRYRLSAWESPPDNPIDRIDPFKIATEVLRINLAELEETYPGKRDFPSGNLPNRIGAVLDRSQEKISLARDFRIPARRFLLAHMLGHWQLHGNVPIFQDSPLIAGDRVCSKRPWFEREASHFAEELLMPTDLVRRCFHHFFGVETFRGRVPDEGFAKWLGRGTERRVTLNELVANGRDHMALLIASFIPAGNRALSLAGCFKVNVLAMSIRLQKLGLI
jgi:hypothetical protein